MTGSAVRAACTASQLPTERGRPVVYPGAGHEFFTVTNQAEGRAYLLAWLDARFPARS